MAVTSKEKVYRRLSEGIISGQYPAGMHLKAGELARKLKVSQVPVREAMFDLAGKGLVEYRPRVGAFVRAQSAEELQQLFELRLLFEPFAAEQAALKANRLQLEALEKAFERFRRALRRIRDAGSKDYDARQLREEADLDLAFHTALLDATGNTFLRRFGDNLRSFFSLGVAMGMLPTNSRDEFISILASDLRVHYRVLAAIRRRDPSAAAAAMRQGILTGRDRWNYYHRLRST